MLGFDSARKLSQEEIVLSTTTGGAILAIPGNDAIVPRLPAAAHALVGEADQLVPILGAVGRLPPAAPAA